MTKKNYKVIGVMSGTSLDGIDLVCVNFKFQDTWSFTITAAQTIPYTKQWVSKLKKLVVYTSDQLNNIDIDYTSYLAQTITAFIKKHAITNIDAVCSHGHTALHKPDQGLTYQIGNMPHLASILKQTVVCNFRVQDVELGGQGAPLVPIGDALLFPEYDFCLNLGGFANISTQLRGQRIAYDICPVNIVLNTYTRTVGLDYDDKGHMASTGSINQLLLQDLNSLEFYSAPYPKSLGLEWVDKHIFPLINSSKTTLNDVLRTFVEHVAIKLALEINKTKNANVLVTGGGVYNTFLIERLKTYTENKITVPNKAIIDFKEALIFGLLGVLRLEDKVNCLKSVTGAAINHSSGKIYYQ